MRTSNRRAFASLRMHRNYRLYFLGQAISQCGTWIDKVAQAWLVLALTHSAFAVGLRAALTGRRILVGRRRLGERRTRGKRKRQREEVFVSDHVCIWVLAFGYRAARKPPGSAMQ